ncbi:DUF429 domain-containing protein [Thiocapsa imhoffii]|uniref:DUF429 domain-containing protein n=2 Tax=Thiocapsa imhoffii TaxID=382777 RepID=A0A9X1B757_9GAMM|nr:DUF429 domain-containing protein [Thiocapsa imhoffii]
MRVLGVDFTSRPSTRKPITCITCQLEGATLTPVALEEWCHFDAFEAALARPGPWICGFDFPFGQSRTFLTNAGWPDTWSNYVRHAQRLGRDGFRAELDRYRRQRAIGDKEHRRATDIAAGAISPQKLYGVPVGLMFFEGAPRLLKAGVTIPGLLAGDPLRIAVETYPGVLARRLIGRCPYKQDSRGGHHPAQASARERLLAHILDDTLSEHYGLRVLPPTDLDTAADSSGDRLDALICAIQAAWAWRASNTQGWPGVIDALEGVIADPCCFEPQKPDAIAAPLVS